jgi:hypothetical protein
LLNPSTDKFLLEFSRDFFPPALTKKYDAFLFYMNGPVKYMQPHLMESIQSVAVPGWNIQTATANGLNNLKGVNPGQMGQRPGNMPPPTVNRVYAGNAPINEIVDGNTVNVTFRNTMINWMYMFECMRGYYDRTRKLEQFQIIITLMNAAEIPLLQFVYSDCMVAIMPGLEFSFAQSFREAKTIDAGFVFNRVDVNFLIPQFKVLNSGSATVLNSSQS